MCIPHQPGSGILEVFHDGLWGSVCDHGFTTAAAEVACREIGYDGGVPYFGVVPYTPLSDGEPVWLDLVECTGTGMVCECMFFHLFSFLFVCVCSSPLCLLSSLVGFLSTFLVVVVVCLCVCVCVSV